jgi:serine protease Do
MVSLTPPGAEAKIVVIRDGKTTNLLVELGSLEEGAQAGSVPKKELMDKLGFSVQDVTEDLAQQFGYSKKEGVLISQVQPGSLAYLAGLRAGMIVLEVNRSSVNNSEEFYRALTESTKTEKALLLVKDNQYSKYVVLSLK